MTTLRLIKSWPSRLCRLALILIPLVFACFALSLTAQAVSPAPEGGYPGGNTAEGKNALLSLTTGGFNTAVGFFSLRSNVTGQFNTATGAGTLLASTADENTATGAGALLSNTTGPTTRLMELRSLTTPAEHGQWSVRALKQHDRQQHHSYWIACAAKQYWQTKIPPLVQERSVPTTPALKTRRSVLVRSLSNTTAGANGSGANTAVGAFALSDNTTGGANTAIGYAALAQGNGGANIGDRRFSRVQYHGRR